MTPWSAPFGFDIVAAAAADAASGLPRRLRWTPTEGAEALRGVADRHGQDRNRAHERPRRARVLHLPPEPAVDRHRALARARHPRRHVQLADQRPAGLARRRVEPDLQLVEPAGDERPDPARSARVSDVFSDGSAKLTRARADARLHVDGKPDALRRVRGALPRRDLHRQAVPEPRLHRRSRRQPRVGAASRWPAVPCRSDPSGVTAARTGYLGDGKESQQLHVRRRQADADRAAEPGDADDDRSRRNTRVPGNDLARRAELRRLERLRRLRVRRSGASPVTGSVGPPVSLWDVDWPQSGYYWTVVPVAAVGAAAGDDRRASRRAEGHDRDSRSRTRPASGRRCRSRSAWEPAANRRTIASVGSGTLTLDRGDDATASRRRACRPRSAAPLNTWTRSLPQDICAAGRVQRLGISSEPSLTSAQTPFATGLSSTGRLTSAANTSDVLRPAARRVDAGVQRRHLRGAVQQDGVSVQGRDRPAFEGAGLPDLLDLRRPAARARHLVLPRARHRLQPADRCAADELVRPREARRREAEVQGHAGQGRQEEVQGAAVEDVVKTAHVEEVVGRRTLVLRFTVTNVSATENDARRRTDRASATRPSSTIS